MTEQAETTEENTGAIVGGVAADHLLSFVERIEKLEEEKKGVSDDIKEIFAELKGTGFDATAVREILKIRKLPKAERQEREYMLDLYRHALGLDDDAPVNVDAAPVDNGGE